VLSRGGHINVTCVWLYTVCLVESRSILEAYITVLKDVPRIAETGLLYVKVIVMQMISLTVLCTPYQQGYTKV